MNWFKLKEEGLGYELFLKVKKDPMRCTAISENFYISGRDYIFYIPGEYPPYFATGTKYKKDLTRRDRKWIEKAHAWWIDWTVEHLDDELIKSGIERYRKEIEEVIHDHSQVIRKRLGLK